VRNYSPRADVPNVAPRRKSSISEVYVGAQVHPQLKSCAWHTKPVIPRSRYDEGECSAENPYFAYLRQNSLGIMVAGISNTYGLQKHSNDGSLESNAVIRALLRRQSP
jgi:hypothetical protein